MVRGQCTPTPSALAALSRGAAVSQGSFSGLWRGNEGNEGGLERACVRGLGCGGASTNSRALPLGTREAIGGGLRLGAPPRQGPGPYRRVFPRQVCIIGMCVQV